MAEITPKATPAQQGVQYITAAAPTFDSENATFTTGNLVADPDSWTVKEAAELDRNKNGSGDVDNIGTAGHHLVGSGEFKVASGTTIPNKGDSVVDAETPGRYWIITSDVEVSGYSGSGKALMVKFDVEYHKEVSDAIIAALP